MIDVATIQRLVRPEDVHKLSDVLFYRGDDGSWLLFEEYRIHGSRGNYTVEKYGQPVEHKFSALKYALCYCINSRRNKLASLRDLVELDRKLCSLQVEILIQTSMLNTSNGDLHEIKLNECILHRNLVLKKLSVLIDECDRWQTTKFGKRLNLSAT